MTPRDIILDEKNEDIKGIEKSLKLLKERRSVFNFELVNIPIGAEIYFARNEKIKAKVRDNRHIEYDGKATSLTKVATELLGCKYDVQGPAYWMYNGETLDERRKRFARESDE